MNGSPARSIYIIVLKLRSLSWLTSIERDYRITDFWKVLERRKIFFIFDS